MNSYVKRIRDRGYTLKTWCQKFNFSYMTAKIVFQGAENNTYHSVVSGPTGQLILLQFDRFISKAA